MGEITKEHVKKAFEAGKAFYRKKLTLKQAAARLTKIGMNEGSARDYIYRYSDLIEGKSFTRTMNTYATEYYLKKIHEETGTAGLKNALLALSQHIDYYEQKSGSRVKKRKEIYRRYLKLIDSADDPVVYPDEVDEKTDYTEGKVRQVLINNYERNPVARKKCIEHYGLNCQVCGFNFREVYGELGKGFIHVHHIVDIASVGKKYSVDPIKDLIPVCPNCHAMLHKNKPAFSIRELKEMLARRQTKS